MPNRTMALPGWARALALAVIGALGLLAIVASGGGGGDDTNCSFFSNVCNPVVGPLPPPVTAQIHPPRAIVQVGGAASFTLETSGITNASYQWRRSADRGASYVDIAGATAAGYTLAGANLGDDGTLLRVDVRDAGGATVAMAWANLLVSAMPAVVFEDGEFAPADWTVAAFAEPAASGPSHDEQQTLAGGHPGAFRTMVHTMPRGPATLRVAHVAQPSRYDPATQGGIYVIDHTEDCLLLSNTSGYQVASRLLIEQAGRRYVTPWASTCTSASWGASVPDAALDAAAFVLLDGPACNAGESCPDFSATAAPLRFGFLRHSQAPDGRAGTLVHGIDNWKVTVWRH